MFVHDNLLNLIQLSNTFPLVYFAPKLFACRDSHYTINYGNYMSQEDILIYGAEYKST